MRVEVVDALTMLFYENGRWVPDEGHELTFSNVFRWSCHPDGRMIRLEHLRFGLQNPVYLFDLAPASPRVLASAEPHVCQEDLYSARMEVGDATIHLSWTVTGPRKNERIAYSYK